MNEIRPAMDKVISFLEGELTGLRSGRANPAIVTDIPVDSYGASVPLKQVAQVSTPDATTIVVTPWDKGLLQSIESALTKADLGAHPASDGSVVRVSLPQMTEERRKELTKVVGEKLEAARVSLRNLRHEAITEAEKEGLPEDAMKHRKDELTKVTNEYSQRLEDIAEAKKKELLTI